MASLGVGEFDFFLGGLPAGVWQVTFLEGWSVLYGLVKNRNLNTSEASIKSSLKNFFAVLFLGGDKKKLLPL